MSAPVQLRRSFAIRRNGQVARCRIRYRAFGLRSALTYEAVRVLIAPGDELTVLILEFDHRGSLRFSSPIQILHLGANASVLA
jgi:hypothetical protein